MSMGYVQMRCIGVVRRCHAGGSGGCDGVSTGQMSARRVVRMGVGYDGMGYGWRVYVVMSGNGGYGWCRVGYGCGVVMSGMLLDGDDGQLRRWGRPNVSMYGVGADSGRVWWVNR